MVPEWNVRNMNGDVAQVNKRSPANADPFMVGMLDARDDLVQQRIQSVLRWIREAAQQSAATATVQL